MIEFNPHNPEKPATGKVLISEPFLNDPYFKRTVVLLCEHDDEVGSFGFILNKFLELELQELLNNFPEYHGKVAMGGPVDQNSLYFLHTRPDLLKDSRQVIDNIYIGGHFDDVKEYLNTGVLQESEIRFFIGYSGWGKNQLQQEMEERSWIVGQASSDMIMNDDGESMWSEALRSLGDQFAILANFPEDPSWN